MRPAPHPVHHHGYRRRRPSRRKWTENALPRRRNHPPTSRRRTNRTTLQDNGVLITGTGRARSRCSWSVARPGSRCQRVSQCPARPRVAAGGVGRRAPELYYESAGRRSYLAAHGAYLEILDHRLRVLATAAGRAEEIDVERAKAAHEASAGASLRCVVRRAPAFALHAMAQARLDVAAQKGRTVGIVPLRRSLPRLAGGHGSPSRCAGRRRTVFRIMPGGSR